MSVLLITEADVCGLLTMDDTIAAVEEGLRKLALDEADNVPRSRCRTDCAMLHVMSASAKSLGALGFKAYATSKTGATFIVGLFDGRTGALTALIQGDHLGRMRTGAASGVATKYFARADARVLGVLGTGRQARTQLIAMSRVRPLTGIRAFSRTPERCRAFAEEMSAVTGIAVEPTASAREAVDGADIVVTATDSRDPVLSGEWLTNGVHINAVGSNFLGKAEIDGTTIVRANAIVVDNKEQAKLEAGDLAPAVNNGSLRWNEVSELGAVIVGRSPGRQDVRDITLFKSVGLAIEDVAAAVRVVELARQRGIGREIDF